MFDFSLDSSQFLKINRFLVIGGPNAYAIKRVVRQGDLLTFSLLTGVPYMTSEIGEEYTQKIMFSIIAWVTYLYLLFKKSYFGINDIAAANMTIGGLAFLLFAYLGTKFFIG